QVPFRTGVLKLSGTRGIPTRGSHNRDTEDQTIKINRNFIYIYIYIYKVIILYYIDISEGVMGADL
ncbi:MAG: hypothetical protein J8272_01075, partial ['Prunus persica' phytoplasma PP2]|nr:hypothetical protein ['Prunus persica' phytoplasma PP2]